MKQQSREKNRNQLIMNGRKRHFFMKDKYKKLNTIAINEDTSELELFRITKSNPNIKAICTRVPEADSRRFSFSSHQHQHRLCYHSIILIKNPETIRPYEEDNDGWFKARHLVDIFGDEATNLIGAETLAAVKVATMVGNKVTKLTPRRGPMQLDSMLAASRENEGEERAKPA